MFSDRRLFGVGICSSKKHSDKTIAILIFMAPSVEAVSLFIGTEPPEQALYPLPFNPIPGRGPFRSTQAFLMPLQNEK